MLISAGIMRISGPLFLLTTLFPPLSWASAHDSLSRFRQPGIFSAAHSACVQMIEDLRTTRQPSWQDEGEEWKDLPLGHGRWPGRDEILEASDEVLPRLDGLFETSLLGAAIRGRDEAKRDRKLLTRVGPNVHSHDFERLEDRVVIRQRILEIQYWAGKMDPRLHVFGLRGANAIQSFLRELRRIYRQNDQTTWTRAAKAAERVLGRKANSKMTELNRLKLKGFLSSAMFLAFSGAGLDRMFQAPQFSAVCLSLGCMLGLGAIHFYRKQLRPNFQYDIPESFLVGSDLEFSELVPFDEFLTRAMEVLIKTPLPHRTLYLGWESIESGSTVDIFLQTHAENAEKRSNPHNVLGSPAFLGIILKDGQGKPSED